jgi:quinol monooxygenase YgiN
LILYVTHMRVNAENAEAYETLMRDVQDKVAEHEPGCYCYFARKVDDPELFVVVDVYPDQASQTAHRAADYLPSLLERAAKLVQGDTYDVKRYEI